MDPSFLLRTNPVTISAILSVTMVAGAWLGHRFGLARKGKTAKGEERSLGATEGALLALFGLLLAFSFSMSGNRFETRRNLAIEEANAIGTAVLRADLYTADERQGFRNDF